MGLLRKGMRMGRGSRQIQHGSLFSGIGGFDLAAEWMGWNTVFHCEINEFCRRLLKYYWPKATTIKNIIGYEWKKWKGRIDVLSGGFPCQPFSIAGKRLGKEDSRYLWPEMLRAIREIEPRWVVAENVRGLINWNEGMVFHEMLSDLEASGYEVLPFLLSAAGIGAPHQRARVWLIANANRKGFKGRTTSRNTQTKGKETFKHTIGHDQCDYWSEFPTQPPVCGRDDGLSGGVDPITIFEGVPFPVNPISYSRWRKESIQAFGNAIVPEVALQIFKVIHRYESEIAAV